MYYIFVGVKKLRKYVVLYIIDKKYYVCMYACKYNSQNCY